MVSSCNKKKQDIEQFEYSDTQIINSVLCDLIDTLSIKYNFNKKYLLYHDIYPDQVKKSSIENFLQNVAGNDEKINLASNLLLIINDSLIYQPVNCSLTKISIDENVKDYIEYFGFISLSKISLNNNKDFGCFYFSIQCGSDCGSGFLVFIEKLKKHEWKVNQIMNLWN